MPQETSADLEQTLQALKAEIAAETARGLIHPVMPLREYVREAWNIVEPSTVYVDNWHIGAICEHLEAVRAGQIKDLLINIPPRHMKSLIVSVFWPTWEWTINPERRWIFSSYALSLSKRDSLKCRHVIESPWYQERWGGRFQLKTDQNEKMRFENNRTGYRIATSVGGAATGEGGDRIVVDDPHNVKEAESDAMRESVMFWWDNVMSTRINDPKTGAKVVVMQRVHERDLSGHILKQGGWEHLCIPAEYEPKPQVSMTGIGWSDPRKEPGELLWPARFGAADLARLKVQLGSYGAAGQLQQRPSPAGGGLIKRDWWRFYDRLPGGFDIKIQSWDMAFKDEDDSSFVVGQVWAKRGPNKYLIDQVRGQMDFVATITAFHALTAKHPDCAAKLIEDKANGPAVIATVSQRIAGVIPVSPEGSKIARAAAVSPEIESGNVYLPSPDIAPWILDFIEEHASFPKGANDDQVDAMSQAMLRLMHMDALVQENEDEVPDALGLGSLTEEEPEYDSSLH